MNDFTEKITHNAIPAIEKAIGDDAKIACAGGGIVQFRIVSSENLDRTNGDGKWRGLINETLAKAGARDVKIMPVANPFAPAEYALYFVTALGEKKTFLAGR